MEAVTRGVDDAIVVIPCARTRVRCTSTKARARRQTDDALQEGFGEVSEMEGRRSSTATAALIGGSGGKNLSDGLRPALHFIPSGLIDKVEH